jgi:hypothetical protein
LYFLFLFFSTTKAKYIMSSTIPERNAPPPAEATVVNITAEQPSSNNSVIQPTTVVKPTAAGVAGQLKALVLQPSKTIRQLVIQLARYALDNKLYRSAGGRDWTELEGSLLETIKAADRTRSAAKHPILNGHVYLDPIDPAAAAVAKHKFAGVVRLYRNYSSNLWNFTVGVDDKFVLGTVQQ